MHPSPLTPQQDRKIRLQIEAGRLIEAIRLYRGFTDAGLAEAKRAVEAMRDGQIPPPADGGQTRGVFGGAPDPAAADPSEGARSDVEAFLFAGQKIQAIKRHREATGVGLREAKDAVEAIEADLRRREPLKFRAAEQGKRGGCMAAALALVAVALAAVIAALPAHRAIAADPPPAPAADPLAGAKRVVFLGDSITQAGQYVDDVETELLLAGRRVEVINVGLSSETVSGLSEEGHAGGKFPRPDLHERLDRVLAKLKPNLIVACYGMNDGIYLPLSDERFGAFKAGMTKLHDKAVAAGARIVHCTPPPFDPVPIKAKVAGADKADANHPFEKYDDVLAAYGQWLLDQRAKGWTVIDVGGAMRARVAERRKTDPAFTFSRDGVHPDAAGHAVMAEAIGRGLGVPADEGNKRFGDPTDAASVRARLHKLVSARRQITQAAWLTETGHKRPGVKAGLPMDQANEKAGAVTKEIEKVVEEAGVK
jgi:ribosomal protein L7/L12/lysophospholipase L1-like esterase